jgi:hypothetical protein
MGADREHAIMVAAGLEQTDDRDRAELISGDLEGDRVIRIPPSLNLMLEDNRARFIERFGREPTPEDPIFWDTDDDGDEPVPIDMDRINRELVLAMMLTNTRRQIIYATLKTGRLITTTNEHLVPAAAKAEWEEAVGEYLAAHPDEDEAERLDPASKDDAPGAVVYFIRAQRGRVKIGTTTKLGSRMRSLRTMSPDPIELLAVIPGGRSIEAQLHTRFARHRKHGEWFDAHPDLLEYIDAVRFGRSG